MAWGEIKGSGAAPYRTALGLDGPAFRCTCPSRKFPCKHGLGLFLLLVGAEGAIAPAPVPDWVAEWAAKRGAGSKPVPKDAEAATGSAAKPVDAKAQERRRRQREAKVSAGMEELDPWLRDLVRRGLASARGEPYAVWDRVGARLVDAQAPGLARRVRALPGLLAGGGGVADEDAVLALGRLALLVRGWRRQDALDDALRAELRAAIGFAPGAEDLAALPGVDGHWTVLAQTVEDEEALRVRSTWLACAGGRVAQVLDFAAGERSFPPAPGPGHAFRGAVVFHPGATGLLLVEGPPDADALIPLAADPAMEPPVALLVYQADEPRRAGFYPFAAFSPEWVALRFALAGGAAVRFMDLPQSVRLALPAERDEAPKGEASGSAHPRRDPLGELARAAGFEDGERWWDELVESRATRGEGVFAAVAEAMAALREAMPDEGAEAVHEERREAWMRTTIRAAAREGFARIAAVCGAWHAPAPVSHDARGQAAKDAATLKGPPRVKTEAAWAPWSYERLAAASGYRAGVISPEWYDLVWHKGEAEKGEGDGVAAHWMARAAGLLRAEDLDASPASVIEVVRLAETLAALRGRRRPALPDLDEACAGALLFADPAQAGGRRTPRPGAGGGDPDAGAGGFRGPDPAPAPARASRRPAFGTRSARKRTWHAAACCTGCG